MTRTLIGTARGHTRAIFALMLGVLLFSSAVQAQAVIKETPVGREFVRTGRYAKFFIKVKNTTAAAQTVTVTDTLPPGFTFPTPDKSGIPELNTAVPGTAALIRCVPEDDPVALAGAASGSCNPATFSITPDRRSFSIDVTVPPTVNPAVKSQVFFEILGLAPDTVPTPATVTNTVTLTQGAPPIGTSTSQVTVTTGPAAVIASPPRGQTCAPGTNELPTNLIANGNFASLATGPFPVLAGTLIAGASFRSGFDYTGNDIYAADNKSSIQVGDAVYHDSEIDQGVFPGDGALTPPSNTFLYTDGNFAATPLNVFEQDLSGLTIGETYVLSTYVSNALGSQYVNDRITSGTAGTLVEPNIRLEVQQGAAIAASTPEKIVAESSPIPDTWVRLQLRFTATQTTATVRVVDSNVSANDGDDFAITQVAVRQCGLSTPPAIGLAKRFAAPAVAVGDGSYDVTYELLARNYGPEALNNVQITENLATTFSGASSFQVKGPPVVVETSAGSNASANAAFDGKSNFNLLGPGATLLQNGFVRVRITANVRPASVPALYQNSAVASGVGANSGRDTTDQSHDSATLNPDPDNDGDPGNNNTPTPTPVPSGNPQARDDETRTPINTPVRFQPNPVDNDIPAGPPLQPCTIDLDPSTPGQQRTITVPGKGRYDLGPAPACDVTFTPEPGFTGVVSTPYTVSDGTNTSNQAQLRVIVVGPPLDLRKRALQPVVNYGDIAPFELIVTNNSTDPLTNVTITDRLPLGLIYRVGSGRVDGIATVPAVVDGADTRQTLTWPIGNLAPGQSRTLRFDTTVTTSFQSTENIATATGTPPEGPPINSPPAKTPIKLVPGVFGNNTTIVGRVYYDNNDNNSFEDGIDQPLPGARVYLSDGRWSVTDDKGRYSIPEVTPGVYAVRLDPLTAPCIPKHVPDDQGQPGTRFVRTTGLTGGGVINEDFPLYPQGGLATKARSTTVARGETSLVKTVTQAGAGYAITETITVAVPSENFVITDPLPSGATRGEVKLTGPNGQVIPVTVSSDGRTLSIQGVLEPGKYVLTYALFTPLPPEQVVTDPDITWEEVVR